MPNKPSEITETKKESLLKIAREISDGNEPVGVAVYGSQVAGYANEESDYDIIIVLDQYSPRVKYRYISGEMDVSALIVDRGALILDADSASLGEFVSGRLLNIYLPLLGKNVFREAELQMKRRVVLESLEEIEATIGQFAQEILIPVEYFLFDKLKKRAAIYPPALYSYSMTYGEGVGHKNTKSACEGFLKVLMDIEEEGLIKMDGSIVQIMDVRSKNWIKRLSEVATYTRRGITQYAVHGYAGRVGLGTIRHEVSSKIARSRKGYEVPDVISHPRHLWKLDEGLLIVDEDDWLGRLTNHLGLERCTEVSKDSRGEIYTVVKIYSIKNGERSMRFTVKNFADLKSLKWVVLNIWAFLSKRFDMSPMSRFYREYSALRKLREKGFNTPLALAVALDQKLLVTEYIDGHDMGQILPQAMSGEEEGKRAIQLYGETLGRVHHEGYTLGDTKPSNTIYRDGKVYLVDLEQAARNNDRGWDIAEFIYYSSKLTTDSQAVRQLVEEFLNGYLKYGDRNSIREALRLKYMAPFQPILSPNIVRVVRQEIRKKAGEDHNS
jgi:Kae1-associated kinase Bud32